MEQSEPWYLADTPEKDPANDAFGHDDVADNLLTMIRGAKSERLMIGLLGGFGVGKSTVIELLRQKLRGDKNLTVIRVSAERHEIGGFHRSFVFAVAEELAEVGAVRKDAAEEQLLGLEYSSSTAMSDFSSSPAARLARRVARIDAQRTLSRITWWIGAAIGLATIVSLVIWLAGGNPISLLSSGFASLLLAGATLGPIVQSLAKIAKPEQAAASMLKPGTLTRSRPRVEAADEFERAFGRLVELVKGRLVIAVDDIDRLSPEDVLAGLNSIRSFQLTCKDSKRPIFIVSADERIIATAIKRSDPGWASVEDKSDASAMAYLNRLFTQRQHVPPHDLGDIQGFAKELLTRSKHKGASHLGDELDDVLNVLIHDRVNDPRHVVRLLNTFFGDFRLALLREQREGVRSISKGEITGQPKTLARLTVFKVDFPRFYASLQTDLDLVESSERIVAGRQTATDEERLRDAGWEAGTEEGIRLASYVGRTAGWVDGSIDLLPFIYLGQDELDRDLGSKDARLARSLLANAQVSDLRKLLNQSGPEKQAGFTKLISENFSRLPQHELSNAVQTAVAVASEIPQEELPTLADSIAASLPRTNGLPLEHENLAMLVTSATKEHLRGILLDKLLAPVAGELESQWKRDLVVLSNRSELASVGGDERLRGHLTEAVESLGKSGPKEALGDLLEALESAEHTDLAAPAAAAVLEEIKRTGDDFSQDWLAAALLQFERVPEGEHGTTLSLLLPIMRDGLEGSLGEFLAKAASRLRAADKSVLAGLPRALKDGMVDHRSEEVSEKVTSQTQSTAVGLIRIAVAKAPGYTHAKISIVRYASDLLAAFLRARPENHLSNEIRETIALILKLSPKESGSIVSEICRLLEEPKMLPEGSGDLLKLLLKNLDRLGVEEPDELLEAFIQRLRPASGSDLHREVLPLLGITFGTAAGAERVEKFVLEQIPYLIYNDVNAAETVTEVLTATFGTSEVSSSAAQRAIQQYQNMTAYGHPPAASLVARAMCAIPWPDHESQSLAMNTLLPQRGYIDDASYGMLIDNLAQLLPRTFPDGLVEGLTSAMRTQVTSSNPGRRANVEKLWPVIDPVDSALIACVSRDGGTMASDVFAEHGPLVGIFIERLTAELDSGSDMPSVSEVLAVAHGANAEGYDESVRKHVANQLARDAQHPSKTWQYLLRSASPGLLEWIAEQLVGAWNMGEVDALSTLPIVGAIATNEALDKSLAPFVSATMDRWIRSEANTMVARSLAEELHRGTSSRGQMLLRFGPRGPRKDDAARAAYEAVRQVML